MRQLTLSLLFLQLTIVLKLEAQDSQIVNVVAHLGAYTDGTHPTETTQAFQRAFDNYPNGKIIVPPGTYAIDNSSGAMVVNGFNGELKFEGGAVLMFQSNLQGGIRFIGGKGARIEGLHGNYLEKPTIRHVDEFSFTSSNDYSLKNVIAENSPAAGFLFTLCYRPKVVNATAQNALADGFIFANCKDAELTNLTSDNTLDNGLALYNYELYENLNGATITNVQVSNSYAHGIAVLGTTDVVISGFLVDTTRGSAVIVGQDAVYKTRISDNVTIQHGYVRKSGTITPPGGTTFGLEYNQPITAVFSDILVEGSAGRSVSGTGATSRVYFRNIRSKDNTQNDAFVFYKTAFVDISDCTAENSPGTGFFFNQVDVTVAHRLKAINVAQASNLNRAVWFENGNYLSAAELMIVDNQSAPTGFVVGTVNGGSNTRGSIHGLISAIANGQMVINNYASDVKVSVD